MSRSYKSVEMEIDDDDIVGKLKLRIVRAYQNGEGVRISADELQEFSYSSVGEWMDEYVANVLSYYDDDY